jgi:MFS family permease
MFLVLGTFVGAEVFLPFALDRSRGMSSTMAGVILTAGTLTWSIGSFVQSRNPPRWFVPLRMAGSALLLSLGIVVTMLITVSRVPALIGYAGWTIGGLGMGVAFNAVSALTYTLVDKDRVGVAVGATGLAGALGAAVAAGISGALVNAADHRYGEGVTGFRWALAFQAMLGVTAALVILRAPPLVPLHSR